MRTTDGIRQHPHDDAPDTAEAFARLARLPAGTERNSLRDELVRAWLPMAERIAVRYGRRGEPLEDLYQVAALGLVKAVDHYDPDRGRAFAAYAVPTVTGEIKRHFRDHTWALHVPRRVQDLRNRVRRAARELAQTTPGRAPTIAEIADHAHLSEAEVRAGMDALTCFATLSLDAEMPGTDGYSLVDGLGGAEPGYDAIVDRLAVGPYLRRLPERERTILYLRFFGGMTQSRIAQQLGISQMHVSRLLSRCCAQLREEVLAETAEARAA
ncbi:SigB/SigF/SigG family RNA polymerase sigma factor [Streptomyces ipomoeae]|jgi:RNA polymerase sigma-B factor|uniref:SigB/SigF/SigG family RNA polymerase sigma factor n=2 Tax=Streptomyces ipomoeae TaxID=103232 RepID=A0AAE8VW09_9ACTN|nr:SigB/SigF/SigG family RNA polymerase sigma factor [Streptomyces ipomoeae]EKX67548.1 putative RNA polymerase sigma-F factor [Streptomyces ipomoeae 91-03]MDX2692615.1 SigB/SigF/SigG family RNA polymerase sigma factor [Streptomyces ipomoeae]MDX2827512.1 SigB/SigF/SigG family RNA polymerase sigma factor [Streptomyces ipomoeae]MDX2837540.1 SigB/SigF/SigG family RNA polymerase sigma factor [Streptomyces ipomoeae]TQE17843.1 SigB/SigF/SigG family RNA polymerase sigma factor [Streptomyces ipomoeae]